MLGVVDPKCTIMAFHLYAGILKVVPLMLDVGEQLKAFNCRLDDLYAIDMQFLHGYDRPSIAYLAEASCYIAYTLQFCLDMYVEPSQRFVGPIGN